MTTGLYIHVPFCAVKCGYCSFYVVPRRHYQIGRLVRALQREIKHLDEGISVQTVYVGGGSPSYLLAEELCGLVATAVTRFQKVDEVTVEVNPDQVDRALLEQLLSVGVNRISIGAQSFHDDELEFLNRTYRVSRIQQVVSEARKAGFENISLDLIFALPGSTIASWDYSLKEALCLEVDHLSAYSLTVEKGTLLAKQVAAGEIEPATEALDVEQYEWAVELLEAGGLPQYEISNFARPGYECRHNSLFWAGRAYIGIGPSAGGYFDGKRTTNIRGIRPYIEAVENNQSVIQESYRPAGRQRACETAVLMLRRVGGITFADFREMTGFRLEDLFGEVIAEHVKWGNLEKSERHIALAPRARAIADAVLCDFSAL